MKKHISLWVLLLFFLFGGKINAQKKIFNVKDFGAKGNGIQSDHEAFKKLSKAVNDNKGNCKVIIPKGKYKVGRQVKGGNGYLLFGENIMTFTGCANVEVAGNNANIFYESGFYFGSFDADMRPYHSKQGTFADIKYAANAGCVIKLENCNNINIHDLNMDGKSNTYILGGKFGDTGYQLYSDGIVSSQTTNLKLSGLNITNFGRDGFMVGVHTPKDYSGSGHGIEVSNCKFTFNGRQGASVIGGVGISFTNCEFNNTGQYTIRSMPCAGVDVEEEWGLIRNVRFKKCKFINNKNSALLADSGDSNGITAEDCLFIGLDGWTIYNNKPGLKVNNCKIYGSIVGAFFEKVKENGAIFTDCYFADTMINGKLSYGGFLAEINGAKFLQFNHCIFNAKYKKAIWIEGRHDNKENEQPILDNCTFIVKMDRIKKSDYILVARLINYKNTEFRLNTKKENMNGRFLQMSKSNDWGNNKVLYSN